MKKRILALLLATALVLGILGGCAASGSTTTTAATTAATTTTATTTAATTTVTTAAATVTTAATTAASTTSAATTAPAEPKPVTLTAFFNSVGEFDPENEVHAEIIKRTGVTIEYIFATTTDGQELTTMLASGDLTDFVAYNTSSSFRSALWTQGFLEPLNKLIDEYDPEMRTDVPENMEVFWTESDGNWYVIPKYYGDTENYDGIEGMSKVETGYAMLSPVYEALGSPSIATFEEYTELLRQVKAGYSDRFDYYLYNPQITEASNDKNLVQIINRAYGGTNCKVVDENGNVHLNLTDETYYNALKYLNSLYLEGLFNPENFTSADSYGEIATNKKIFSYWGQGVAIMDYDANEATREYHIYEMPRADGVDLKLKLGSTSIGRSTGVSITTCCADKEAAIRYMHFLLTKEGQFLTYHGIEGVHYTLVDGYPKNTAYKQDAWSNDWGKLTNKLGIMGIDSWFPFLSTDAYYYKWLNVDLPYYEEQIGIYDKYANDELWSDLAKVETDTDEAVIESKITEYWNNSLPGLVLAEKGAFEAAYEKFVAEVRAMGLEQLEAGYTKTVQGWMAKLK